MRFHLKILVFLSLASSFSAIGFSQTPTTSSDPLPASKQAPKIGEQTRQQQVQQFQARLLAAMDRVIPGQLNRLSQPQHQELERIATLFADRKLKDCREAYQQLTTINQSLPPVDLVMASLFLASNNTKIGLPLLEQAATTQPDYPSIPAQFARLAINQRRLTDTEALLLMVKSKIDAGNWSELQKRHFQGEYLDAKTDLHLARNQLDDADNCLSELVGLRPDDHAALVRHARVSFRQDNIEQSIRLLELAREKANHLFPAPLMIAILCRQQGDFEKLKTWITQAAEKYPDDPNVQIEYVRWLIEQRKFADAETWIAKAESGQADKFTIVMMRGQIAFIQRLYEVAQTHFSNIHTAQPGNNSVKMLLALSLLESGQPEQQRRALQLASISSQIDTNSVDALSVLAWINHRLGNTLAAGQGYQRILQQNQLSAEATYFLAQFLSDRERYTDARKTLQSIEENPGIFLYQRQANDLMKELEAKLKE